MILSFEIESPLLEPLDHKKLILDHLGHLWGVDLVWVESDN